MKTISFTVTLKFSDSINDDREIHEIAKNIAHGLNKQRDEMGIAPLMSDAYVNEIVVEEPFSETRIELNY